MSNHLSGANAQFIIVSATLLCGGRQMVRYRIAVCDDEPSELEDIVQSVKRYDVHGDFDIENYTDGAMLLSDLQQKKKFFNLLLLDIEMPSNGFQMAQTLIQMEKHPLVIFVTKRHEYAVQGYGIAFRYLVKPLDESLFTAAMDAVVQELHSKHFTVEYEGATLSLETSDIYYLESHGHKVLIHCKGQDLTLRMTIPEALEQLPKRCFASPHKSYLVNMEHIVYATGTTVILSSGNQLPISRRKRQEFNQNFNAYLGR
jgi:DNA-binding LytR/AlgR family response regulator